jgi:hypothetical protein
MVDDKASKGEAYDGKEEKELEKVREISEFGETQSHHKHIAELKLQINLKWIEADAKFKNIHCYTVCLPPQEMNDSYQKLAMSIDLSTPAFLSKVLGTHYAIQKPSHAYLVVAHSLHNTAYLVTGDFALSEILKLVEKEPSFLKTKKTISSIQSSLIYPLYSIPTMYPVFWNQPFALTCSIKPRLCQYGC